MTEREALRLALVALEELNKLSIGEHAICLPAEIDTAMDAIKQALEQPKPEPVAWQWKTTAHFRQKLPKNAVKGIWNPLYTSPPKREPLTEGETHCKDKRENGGVCPHHNLQCGWPECNEAAHGIGEKK